MAHSSYGTLSETGHLLTHHVHMDCVHVYIYTDSLRHRRSTNTHTYIYIYTPSPLCVCSRDCAGEWKSVTPSPQPPIVPLLPSKRTAPVFAEAPAVWLPVSWPLDVINSSSRDALGAWNRLMVALLGAPAFVGVKTDRSSQCYKRRPGATS
jgi:hypothetical protein